MTELTHQLDGWLDVLICPPTISDHGLVVATVLFLHHTPLHVDGQFQNWRKLDHAAFCVALLDIPAIANPSTLVDASPADLFSI